MLNRDELEKAIARGGAHTPRIVLCGRTGMGKSTTINTLLGREVARTGDFEPTTVTVERYDAEIEGARFEVYDTPGLCDDLEEAGNDVRYIELMADRIGRADLLWYVTRLDDTRVSSDEKRGMRTLSEAFGAAGWEHAIIVFTFAGNVAPADFAATLAKRTELIRKEIAKYAGERVAAAIPAVAVDNRSETTPDGQPWLGELFAKVVGNISREGLVPFLIATVRRVESAEYRGDLVGTDEAAGKTIRLTERQSEEVRRSVNPALVVGLASTGAAIGSAFGPVGTVVGGAVGALVGFIGSFW